MRDLAGAAGIAGAFVAALLMAGSFLLRFGFLFLWAREAMARRGKAARQSRTDKTKCGVLPAIRKPRGKIEVGMADVFPYDNYIEASIVTRKNNKRMRKAIRRGVLLCGL